MDCPECAGTTIVVDSRASGRYAKRRRRACQACPHRFTTYEIVEAGIAQSVVVRLDMGIGQNGRLVASMVPENVCECGNTARYVVEGEHTPRYCGVCDLIKNAGDGERA